eukprot:PLAT919.1.p1 GENE.PLAT919.1~~PLAT919.1.p1  ORF type:complete len:252 (+),score=113.63 PLAT919.1:108-758(+)
MPVSKRAKQVSLTRTVSKGRALKEDFMSRLREAVDEYDSVIVFHYSAFRTVLFKDVRIDWRDSRFFLGKNRLMQVALGRREEEEYMPGMARLTPFIRGDVGLLFTSRSRDDVISYMRDFSAPDFARPGAIAPRDVILPAGDVGKPTSMADLLRKLGLPVDVRDGELVLEEEFQLAEEGEPLSVQATKLLKLFDFKLAEMKLTPLCRWTEDSFEALV